MEKNVLGSVEDLSNIISSTGAADVKWMDYLPYAGSQTIGKEKGVKLILDDELASEGRPSSDIINFLRLSLLDPSSVFIESEELAEKTGDDSFLLRGTNDDFEEVYHVNGKELMYTANILISKLLADGEGVVDPDDLERWLYIQSFISKESSMGTDSPGDESSYSTSAKASTIYYGVMIAGAVVGMYATKGKMTQAQLRGLHYFAKVVSQVFSKE